MRPYSVSSRSVTPTVFRAVRRLPALRGLASVLACLLALPLCLPFAQAAHADAAPGHSTLATVLQLQALEKQAKAHPALLPSRPANRLANTPYNAPRVSAPALVHASVAPVQPNAASSSPVSMTLLDEVGRLACTVAPAEAAGWQRELTTHPPLARVVTLHIWLGEYALAHDHQPKAAAQQFRIAQHLTGSADALHGLAAYDGALALFYKGAYQDANDAFHRLLLPKTRLVGYDVRACALWWRHASACAGYHAQRSDMGIPEPPQLDPFCGVAALAASLYPLNLPSDRKALLAACRVTGEGSTLADLEVGARKLGASLHRVTVDDKGLIALPKPLIAHVERDHFIAVVRADAKGVSYLCSDCGPWPGGRVNLTWKQWHALDADTFGVAARPGGTWDKALSSLQSSPSTEMGVRVAMTGDLSGLRARRAFAVLSLGALLRGHVFRSVTSGQYSKCDRIYDSLICPPEVICCPPDSGGPGNQAGNPADPGAGAGGPGLHTAIVGPSAGDPVNLATGAEEYAPAADLTVYNPHGPNVVWKRSYDSLRPKDQYSERDFGYQWASSYQMYVEIIQNGPGSPYSTTPVASVYQGYIMLPGGARLGFSSVAPTSATPVVHCTMGVGVPYLVNWYYDAGTSPGMTHFVVTSANRTKWTTNEGALSIPYQYAPLYFQPNTISDRNGNALALAYTSYLYNTPYPVPLLTSISDASTGTVLLTINRIDSNDYTLDGLISSVTDCYGRSVYYNISKYGYVAGGSGTAWPEVDQVSQVVPTGTASALTQYPRYAYGYTTNRGSNSVGDGPAFLHTITVPSPTGSGTQTATINYGDSELVSSIVDANGNKHLYNFNAGDANHTQVTVQNASGSTVYSYTAGYNADMSMASRTDGVGNATYTVNAFDPNDPYRASSVTDGNGRTTQMTWDQYGNMLTKTPPSNSIRTPVATTYTYSYTNFELGELTQVQEGTKTATSYSYNEPSGLASTIQKPIPGTVNGGTVQELFQYDSLGNITSMTRPAPSSTSGATVTTYFYYDADPGDSTYNVPAYSQNAAIGQLLRVVDPAGKTTHFRYDAQGNRITTYDACGDETDATYTIENHLLTTTLPATGQQGAGNTVQANVYLFKPASPLASGQWMDGQIVWGPLSSTTVTDEAGTLIRSVNNTYGPEGELKSVGGSTEPASYTYDALYRLKTLADGSGSVTSYFYNAAGYLYQVAYPGASAMPPPSAMAAGSYDTVTFSSYDINGNVLTRSDGNGVTTTYTHSADPESLLTNIAYSDSTPQVTFAYDGYGRRNSMTDGTGRTTCFYDDNDAVTRSLVLWMLTGNSTTKILYYSYYLDGSRKKLIGGAEQFFYVYDNDGRMTQETDPHGRVSSWAYKENSWLASQTLGNGANTSYTYNKRGQVTDQKTTNSDGITLINEFKSPSTGAFDGAGDRTQVVVSGLPSGYGGTISYAYDQRGQLTNESSTRPNFGAARTYQYDGAAGGTSTGPGNTTLFNGASRTYNADNQTTSNTYDGNGNPTTYQGTALTFDAESRMATSGTAQTNGYTGDGLRA